MLTLTHEEALQFAGSNLGIKEVEKLFKKDKFRLLNELIVAFHNNIPFQTLTNMAVRPDMRHAPDFDEIKEDILSGRGGMCFALNGFFQATLEALGYDCYITGGKMWDSDIDTHVLVIVRNLQQAGDVFLVDVGLGYPTLQAISLDFELESPTVVELVWLGKIARLPSSDSEQCANFVRMRKPMNPAELSKFGFGHREIPDQWNNIYRFNLEPQSFEELHRCINIHIYHNASHVLSRTLRLIKWENSRNVIIINNHLLREEADHTCRSNILDTDEAIVETIYREFPVFDKDFIERGVRQWRCMSGK